MWHRGTESKLKVFVFSHPIQTIISEFIAGRYSVIFSAKGNGK